MRSPEKMEYLLSPPFNLVEQDLDWKQLRFQNQQ